MGFTTTIDLAPVAHQSFAATGAGGKRRAAVGCRQHDSVHHPVSQGSDRRAGRRADSRRFKISVDRLRLLAERKQTILRSIDSQGKLTPELAAAIEAADSIKRLEDLYLPYKPKKQTLATLARERKLEPLAEEILTGQSGGGRSGHARRRLRRSRSAGD